MKFPPSLNSPIHNTFPLEDPITQNISLDPQIQYGYSPGVIYVENDSNDIETFDSSPNVDRNEIVVKFSEKIISVPIAGSRRDKKKSTFASTTEKNDNLCNQELDVIPLRFSQYVEHGRDEIEEQLDKSINKTPWKPLKHVDYSLLRGEVDLLSTDKIGYQSKTGVSRNVIYQEEIDADKISYQLITKIDDNKGKQEKLSITGAKLKDPKEHDKSKYKLKPPPSEINFDEFLSVTLGKKSKNDKNGSFLETQQESFRNEIKVLFEEESLGVGTPCQQNKGENVALFGFIRNNATNFIHGENKEQKESFSDLNQSIERSDRNSHRMEEKQIAPDFGSGSLSSIKRSTMSLPSRITSEAIISTNNNQYEDTISANLNSIIISETSRGSHINISDGDFMPPKQDFKREAFSSTEVDLNKAKHAIESSKIYTGSNANIVQIHNSKFNEDANANFNRRISITPISSRESNILSPDLIINEIDNCNTVNQPLPSEESSLVINDSSLIQESVEVPIYATFNNISPLENNTDIKNEQQEKNINLQGTIEIQDEILVSPTYIDLCEPQLSKNRTFFSITNSTVESIEDFQDYGGIFSSRSRSAILQRKNEEEKVAGDNKSNDLDGEYFFDSPLSSRSLDLDNRISSINDEKNERQSENKHNRQNNSLRKLSLSSNLGDQITPLRSGTELWAILKSKKKLCISEKFRNNLEFGPGAEVEITPKLSIGLEQGIEHLENISSNENAAENDFIIHVPAADKIEEKKLTEVNDSGRLWRMVRNCFLFNKRLLKVKNNDTEKIETTDELRESVLRENEKEIKNNFVEKDLTVTDIDKTAHNMKGMNEDPKNEYRNQRLRLNRGKVGIVQVDPKENPRHEIASPEIGISVEDQRAEINDAEKESVESHSSKIISLHMDANSFVAGSLEGKIMYNIVHNISRRKESMSIVERMKYPTFDDSGDTPENSGNLDSVSLSDPARDLEVMNTVINTSKLPVPGNFRKRGILLARLGKFNKALADFEKAIQLGCP